MLAIAGFLFGFVLATFDKGILEYPAHLAVGVALVSLIIISYATSKKLKAHRVSFGAPHFIVGVGVLALYLVNAFIGLGVLL